MTFFLVLGQVRSSFLNKTDSVYIKSFLEQFESNLLNNRSNLDRNLSGISTRAANTKNEISALFLLQC